MKFGNTTDIDDPSVRRWYVLHVKPRTEKKAVEWLRFYRLWHYLPLYVKISKVQRRKVKRELPLFPGYVFARLNADERLLMLKTNLIVNPIVILEPRKTIHQLRQIARAGKVGQEIRVVPKFSSGDLVKIKAGPLYGVEGYVKKDSGGTSIILNVEILGQAVELSISPEDCEKK